MDRIVFGKFIADTRRELGMTQQALADRLHVTDKAVSKWERGLCYPDLTLIEELAAILGLTPAELMACQKRTEQDGDDHARTEFVRSALDIGKETIHRHGKRIWITTVVIILVIALAAFGAYYYAMTNAKETVSTSFVHKQEDADGCFVYIEKDMRLLRLRCEDRKLYDAIVANARMQYSIVYRWNRFTGQGTLEKCEAGKETLGSPMDSLGSSFGVGSLLGVSDVYQKIWNVYPDPVRERDYLYTYCFFYEVYPPDTAPEQSAVELLLLTVEDCRAALCFDYDDDGIVELWVHTKYDEEPYMLYDLEEGQIESRFVDEVPKSIRQTLQRTEAD